MSSRASHIRALFNAVGKGLEIGPSHSPLMPKRDGFDVEILDYMDAASLRIKYAAAGLDISQVEEVDYLADGRPLTEVVGDTQRFDWIIASHVIEHVPNLIGFLRDCQSLLKPKGVLVLAIPDKRACFDILRPVSTVGQALQAYVEDRKRPSPGLIFDDVAYARKRGGQIGWTLTDRNVLNEHRPITDGFSIFNHATRSEEYIDVHCWVFVPSSFRLLISAIRCFDLISFEEKQFDVAGGEFYSVLQKDGAPGSIIDIGALAIKSSLEERDAHLEVF